MEWGWGLILNGAVVAGRQSSLPPSLLHRPTGTDP